MPDKQTTEQRPSGSLKTAFAKALGLPSDVIERAEAGDQDALRALYAASSGTGDNLPNETPADQRGRV
ncbi:hypothetical protein [Asaia bogorensis]|uniref:hypothetical protein n=1 Tax=Asaia bogorensis TaxID=91915 RepID=UPI00301801DD